MKGRLEFFGEEIEITYKFIEDDTIEFIHKGFTYITHYKSLIVEG